MRVVGIYLGKALGGRIVSAGSRQQTFLKRFARLVMRVDTAFKWPPFHDSLIQPNQRALTSRGVDMKTLGLVCENGCRI